MGVSYGFLAVAIQTIFSSNTKILLIITLTNSERATYVLEVLFFVLVLLLYCYQAISLHPHAHMLSHVIPWTSAHQTPLSMDFSRQEYRSGISTFLICKLLLENFILPYNLNFYFDNIESQVFISRVPFTPSFKSPFLNNYIQKFSEYQLLYSRHASQFHPILM